MTLGSKKEWAILIAKVIGICIAAYALKYAAELWVQLSWLRSLAIILTISYFLTLPRRK